MLTRFQKQFGLHSSGKNEVDGDVLDKGMIMDKHSLFPYLY